MIAAAGAGIIELLGMDRWEQKWVLTNLQNSPIHSHFVGTVQTSVFRLGSQARVIFERW